MTTCYDMNETHDDGRGQKRCKKLTQRQDSKTTRRQRGDKRRREKERDEEEKGHETDKINKSYKWRNARLTKNTISEARG